MAALHIAAREGHILALSCLMNLQYLDVNVPDIWGNAPLDHAAMGKQWSCAVLLASQGGALRASNVSFSALGSPGHSGEFAAASSQRPACIAAKACKAESTERLATARLVGTMPTLLSLRRCVNVALTSKDPQLVAMSSSMGRSGAEVAEACLATTKGLLRRSLQV